MLLARAAGRAHEVAVRIALGAGRGRVLRHFMAESLLLAVCGTAGGLLLNVGATRWAERIEVQAPIPVRLVVDPDWRLALYAALLVTVSALVCGLAPAWNAARLKPRGTLKLGEHPTISGRVGLRRALVAGQLAVSVVLLATGFLFLRSLLIASGRSPGFDVQRTVWMQMRLVPERYPLQEARRTLIERSIEELRRLPGVESAAAVDVVPLNDNAWMAAEMSPDDGKETVAVRCYVNSVGVDYFRTMGIGIVSGREFNAADTADGPPVVILNRTLAKRLFGAANPVGRIVRQGGNRLTVVGVAADSKYFTISEENAQALYWPWAQKRRFGIRVHYLVRTAESPDLTAAAANKLLGALEPSAAVEGKPLKRALGFALLPSQVGALLLGSIGLLALVLASIGLYGLVSYTVTSKLREMGLRVALGATPGDILRLVGREAFALLSVGIVAGLAIAWAASKPLAQFVVAGPSPVDLVGFGAVIATLGIVGLVATVGPARKALRVSPIVALRYE
jgi:predicted permease